jgi:hypothetical protein
MTEKVKVPKWFDGWYKSFGGNESYVYAKFYFLSRVGFGYGLQGFGETENKFVNDKQITSYVNTHKEELIRAILDGYEVEPEYIEITPVEAYERYYNDEYFFRSDETTKGYDIATLQDFIPYQIKRYNIKFYIKKENE